MQDTTLRFRKKVRRWRTLGATAVEGWAPSPFYGGCLVESVVYRATVVQDNSKVDTYTGLTCNKFKDRFYGHRSTFENRDHPNPTTLSTHVWDLKDNDQNF